MCDCGEISYEAAIEVAESQEASDVLNGGWSGPFRDSFNLYGIHFDFPLTNNDTEVFHLLFVEGAFLGFQEEVVVLDFL
jgi:hypothetical protein